jgi:prevent-host-death family protein
MGRVVSTTEARNRFGALVRRVVEDGEPVVVERSGKPQVVVLPIEAYERLSASVPHSSNGWRTLLDEALAEIEAQLGGTPLPAAEETIEAMREERDAQLLDLR